MKAHVLIGMFGGLVETVEVYIREEDAIAAWERHTGFHWGNDAGQKFEGTEIREVELNDGVIYQIYREQERRFHVSDVLERVGEYFEDAEVDRDKAHEYISELKTDEETLNDVIRMYLNYEGKDDSYYGRRSNLDEALYDIQKEIENEFGIKICV